MIKARHSLPTEAFFRPYLTFLLRSNFSRFFLINDLPPLDPARAVVLTPNHISWWDGFIVYCFFRPRLPRRLYLLMLERELSRFRFFRGLGAFSIDPEKPGSVRQTVRYVRTLLSRPESFVVIYPQGRIEPQTVFPLSLKPGLTIFLDRTASSLVVPLAVSISFYNEKRPEIALRFGETIGSEKLLRDPAAFASVFQENVRLCHQAVAERNFISEIWGRGLK